MHTCGTCPLAAISYLSQNYAKSHRREARPTLVRVYRAWRLVANEKLSDHQRAYCRKAPAFLCPAVPLTWLFGEDCMEALLPLDSRSRMIVRSMRNHDPRHRAKFKQVLRKTPKRRKTEATDKQDPENVDWRGRKAGRLDRTVVHCDDMG